MSVINYQTIFESHPLPMWVIDTETQNLLAINQLARHSYNNQIKPETLDQNRLPGVTISSFPLLNDGKKAELIVVNEETKTKLILAKNLQELHRFYWRNLQNNKQMYCQCLTDGTITWVNNSYCNHVSQSLPELVGTKFPFISKEQEHSLLSHITSKNPIIEYEYYNLHLNLWQCWQVEGIFDQDNHLLQYHFLGKDLTKNLLKNLVFLQTIKATELGINQETIVNLSGIFVYKTELNQSHNQVNFIYISDSIAEIYELEKKESINNWRLLLSLIHPEDLPQLISSFKDSQKLLTSWQFTGRIITKSGKMKSLQVTITPEIENSLIIWTGFLLVLPAKNEIIKENQAFDFKLKINEKESQKTEQLLKQEIKLRKITEQKSKQIEERLNLAFEVAEMGTWDWNILTGEITWSPSLLKLFGLELENFKLNYETFLELIHPEDKEQVLAAINQAIEENIPYKIEFRFIKPNGDIRYCLSRGKVLFDEHKNPIYMTGIDRDITHKKILETALAISEEKFRSQYQAIPIPTFTWQKREDDFILIDYNFAAFNFTQGTIANFLNETASSLYANVPEIVADFEQCFNQQQVIKKKMTYRMLSTNENKILIINSAFVPPDLIMVHIEDITESETAWKNLQKSEENYRRLIETTNEGVLVINNLSQVVFVNATIAKMLGYDREEMLQKNWFDFLSESFFCNESDCNLELYSLKKEYKEVKMRQKNGEIIYTMVATNALSDHGNIPIGTLAMITNITELKLHQIALQEAKQTLENRVRERTNQLRNTNAQLLIESQKRQQILQKYDHLMDNLTEIVFQLDSMGNWLFINQAWTQITGFTAAETLGKKFLDFIPLQQRKFCQDQLKELLTGEKISCYTQSEIITKNGNFCWVEISASMSSEEKTIIGIINNITERKQAEEAKQESEARFRSLFEQAAVGVCLIDLEGKFILVNDRYAHILGYDPNDLIGRFYQDFSYPVHFKTESDYWQQLLTGTINNYCLEKCFWNSNELLVWTEVSLSLLRDENKQPKYFIGTVQDISERKETELKLQKSEQQLKQAQRIANLGSWEYDLQTGLLNWSEQLFKIVGLPPNENEPNYEEYLSFLSPDDQQLLKDAFKKAVTEGEAFEIEYSFFRKNDQSLRYISARGEVVKDTQGKVVKLIGTAQDITNRKLIQQEIEEKRLQLLTVIETVNEGITLSDEIGNFLIFNSAMKQITGYSLADLENSHSLIELIYPQSQQKEQAMERLTMVLKTGKLANVETTIVSKSGEEKTLLVSTNILIDKGRKLFLSAYRDITDRNKALQDKASAIQALQESEVKYRRMIETAAEGVFILDQYYQITFVNQKTVEMFALSQAEIIGKNLLDFVAFEHTNKALQYMKNIRQGNFKQEDLKFYRNNGQELWVIMNASPIIDNGEYQGTLVMLTDITERHQNQVKLRATQEHLQYLLSSSSAIIYSCNPENLSCSFISDNIIDLIGYSWQDISLWVEHIHPEDLITLFDKINNPCLDKTVHEYRFLNKNGSYRWLRDEIKIIRDQNGRPEEIIGCILDINDRKLAEQEALKALEKERELSEFKSRFISITSHEFRTPLTTILSSSQLLQRYDWSAQEQQELFEQIDTAVKYLTALIDDVHTINQGKSGVLTFNPKSIFVVNFSRRFLTEIQNGIGINYQITFTLNSQIAEREANLDDKLIRHILSNLFSNAIKYSPQGSLIKFSLTITSEQLIWQITDQGKGIPEEAKNHLFASFYRANNVGTTPGTGLGLAIVKNCIELHNGNITFESILGEGTTFTVTIPLI